MAFPSNPTDGQTFSENGANYTYNASQGIWVQTNVASGGGSGGGGGGGGLVAPSQHASFEIFVNGSFAQTTKTILTGPNKPTSNHSVQVGIMNMTPEGLATNTTNSSGIAPATTPILYQGVTYQIKDGSILFSNAGKYRMRFRSETRFSSIYTNLITPVYNIQLDGVDTYNYSPLGVYVLDGGSSSQKTQSYVYNAETILDVAADDVLSVAFNPGSLMSSPLICSHYFSFHFESLF